VNFKKMTDKENADVNTSPSFWETAHGKLEKTTVDDISTNLSKTIKEDVDYVKNSMKSAATNLLSAWDAENPMEHHEAHPIKAFTHAAEKALHSWEAVDPTEVIFKPHSHIIEEEGDSAPSPSKDHPSVVTEAFTSLLKAWDAENPMEPHIHHHFVSDTFDNSAPEKSEKSEKGEESTDVQNIDVLWEEDELLGFGQ
jgi:hypothetical protein